MVFFDKNVSVNTCIHLVFFDENVSVLPFYNYLSTIPLISHFKDINFTV